MSVNREFEVRTRHITPSARQSIHFSDRPMNLGRMGRYRDESSEDEELQEGVDEVDNVMSKFSHTSQSTPVILSHHHQKRNSLTPSPPQYTDDYDSEEHDPFERLCMESRSRQFNKSGSTSPRANWSGSSSSSFASRSPNVSHSINQSAQNRQRKESLGGTVNLLGLIGLLAVFAAYYYDLFSSARDTKATYDEVRFHSDLNELGAKYKVGDDSILQLQAGISTIFKNEDTSCVLFLYNSKKNNFDPIRFDGFVNNVVSNSAKFLRNDTAPSEPKVVEGAELTMLSHSQLVSAYKEDIARSGVILVKDVGGVPSPLAMAFHYYCDEFQPLVEKSAIFFTLNTARCHNSGEKSSHASVEKCLREKWNTVPKDNIGALLTRVVNIVVDVNGGE